MKAKPLIFFLLALFLQVIIAMLDIYYLDIQSPGELWRLSREGIIGFTIILLFTSVTTWHPIRESQLKDNLLNIIRDILLIFGTGFFLRLLLPASQPFTPDQTIVLTEKEIIYNAIITFVSLFAFTEILVFLKPFLYYRRDRFTQIQYYLFLWLVLLTSVLAAFFNVDSPVNLNFTGKTLYPDIAMIFAITGIIWLATRNKWIPFLSKKEKYFYSIGSLFFFVALIFLNTWLDDIPRHSILAASYANLVWLFLFIYAGISTIYLLFHLPTARLLERKLKEISSLNSLTNAITQELDFDRLVILITKSVSEVIESHSCLLILLNEDKDGLYVASYQDLSHSQIENANKGEGKLISELIMRNQHPVLVESISASDKYRYLKKWHPGMDSLGAVPLITSKKESIGVLYAFKNVRYGFNKDDLTLLESFANQAVIAIENTHRIRESIDRQRLLQEIQIAMDVQKRLLPQKLPDTNCLDIYAANEPANEVGGDYYDFISTNGKYMFLVGDVSGKGTSAAFYMAELKGAIQANSHLLDKPDEMLIKTNNSIFDSLDKSSFITLAIISIDEKKKTIKFARGGHPGLLKINSKGVIKDLNPSGLGLGLVKGDLFDNNIELYTGKIKEDEIYILYTDGITEAMNSDREEYGQEKLEEIIRDSVKLSAKVITENIISDVKAFTGNNPAHDDMTLIVVKVCKKNVSNKKLKLGD